MANNKYEWALPIGTTIIGGRYPYEVVDVLGHGGFGITYKVKARVSLSMIKVDVFFALKEYFPTGCWRGDNGETMVYSPSLAADTKAGLKDFITEGNRLHKICSSNPHIINVNEVFQANDTAYFVMEYLSGGDLRQMIRANGAPLSEATMLSIIGPIGSAVDAVHQNHILHLDIKPENIVMRKGDDGAPDVPVLIDFGIAVHFDNRGNPTTTSPTKGLSPGYASPEQYTGVKRFDPRLDIYALSATCYYMITGKDPKEPFEIEENELVAELTPLVSTRTRDAIVHGMARQANRRTPTMSEFLKSFEESNALPIGTVIQGPTFRYMIKTVLDEKPNYVQYQASIMRGEEQTGGSSTRNISGTRRRLYDLYQQLDGGKHISGGDGVFWDLPALGKARYGAMQYGTQISKTGDILSDYFMIDGAQYLLLCEGYKAPPKGRKPLINWQKAKRPLLIAAAALALAAVAAIVVWGVAKLFNNKGVNDDTSLESDASSTEMVSDTIPGEASKVESEPISNDVPKHSEQKLTPTNKEEPAKPSEKKETTETRKESKKETPKVEEKSEPKTKEKTPQSTSDDDAYRDRTSLISKARRGDKKAQDICDLRGIPWK